MVLTEERPDVFDKYMAPPLAHEVLDNDALHVACVRLYCSVSLGCLGLVYESGGQIPSEKNSPRSGWVVCGGIMGKGQGRRRAARKM